MAPGTAGRTGSTDRGWEISEDKQTLRKAAEVGHRKLKSALMFGIILNVLHLTLYELCALTHSLKQSDIHPLTIRFAVVGPLLPPNFSLLFVVSFKMVVRF